MKKLSGKSKGKASKPAKKRAARKPKKPVDLVEVRKDITNIVGGEAASLTLAVVEEGRKGQLAPVKYLFEMAGLYPAPEEIQVRPEEASLAKTLLHRLGLTESPVIRQEEDLPLPSNSPAGENANGDSEEEESANSGSLVKGRNNQAGDKDADEGDDVPVPAVSIP